MRANTVVVPRAAVHPAVRMRAIDSKWVGVPEQIDAFEIFAGLAEAAFDAEDMDAAHAFAACAHKIADTILRTAGIEVRPTE